MIEASKWYFDTSIKNKYNHKVDPKLLRGDVDTTSYMDGDYHEIFYGEIVSSYTKDDL